MTKAELVAKLARDANVPQAAADRALNSFIATVSKAIAKGDRVALPGLGSFSLAERAAREGRNPQTGETIKIAACKVVKFSAATALKEAVNG